MNLTPAINLLKKKERNFFDEFIKWSLTVGRLIIILTEVIALSAFLYRFSLDRKLIDLHDQIKQKQIILDLFKDSEENYRKIQNKLEKSKELAKEAERLNKIYDDISNFSSDLDVSNFSITKDGLKIDATTQRISFLVDFIKTLRQHEEIKSVSLDRIENKASVGVLGFTITASIKIKTIDL